MKHLKRQAVPKSWPIKRKGTAYVVGARVGEQGLPILLALRDVMKVAQNRKEVKQALHEKNVLLNGKPVREDKNKVQLFDVITIVPTKKNYKLSLDAKGKFSFEEINGSEAGSKVSKVINKTLLKGKKIQINLMDGRNVLSNEKCKTNDSVVMDFKDGKIKKVVELKNGSHVLVIHGKHAGERGKISRIDDEKNVIELETKNGKVNVLIKQAIVTE